MQKPKVIIAKYLQESELLCQVVRAIIYITKNKKDFVVSDLEVLLRIQISELEPALTRLKELKVIEFFKENNQGHLLPQDKETLELFDEAILKYEFNFVKKRAEETNFYAFEKISAIDNLAEQIYNARKNIRA